VTRPRRLAVLVAGVVLLAGLPVASARAESAADAQAEAQAAADRVEALQPVVERALRAYDRALAGLASGVSQTITAEQAADQAAQLALSDRRTANNRVRALYMSGGSSALIASVLSASGPTEPAGEVLALAARVWSAQQDGEEALAAEGAEPGPAVRDGDAGRGAGRRR
jgi:hypothetical protein